MSSAHWAQQIPLDDVIHWLEMMKPGAAEAHPEVNNQTPPPIAYIAALCEHIAAHTQYELMLTAFRKQSILREVASVYISPLLTKVYPEYADEYVQVIIKASECWHNHEDNVFDPIQRWKGLPTPAEACCIDPFPGGTGQRLLEYAQNVPYLRQLVMLVGQNELSLPVEPPFWHETSDTYCGGIYGPLIDQPLGPEGARGWKASFYTPGGLPRVRQDVGAQRQRPGYPQPDNPIKEAEVSTELTSEASARLEKTSNRAHQNIPIAITKISETRASRG
ncbi:hypothetical protein BDV93DRAFT_508749 [Ceratobasidium sp. AG-I]|nr:hypothetical protein BDV93DRAFT_508749 [Ceratobasidium sp. AG-I]